MPNDKKRRRSTAPDADVPYRVGILLFDHVDLLDSGGPYEVFLTAARLERRDHRAASFEVVTISHDGGAVTAYGGLGLVPQASAADVGSLDVLVVPGAIDIDAVSADSTTTDAITSLAARADLTASVCTGAFLLGRTGLLEGRAWTTHWQDVDALAAGLGSTDGRRGVRWVDSGEIITAAGLSSGIAMALHVVDRLASRGLAIRTAGQLDYDWDPEGGARVYTGTTELSEEDLAPPWEPKDLGGSV
jgi:transcriptional regulator GlxA family with amidase domain